jgi:hypothetical protein
MQDRKGVNSNGSYKESSSEEGNEEDRKEEIGIPPRIDMLKAGEEILQPLFLRSSLI